MENRRTYLKKIVGKTRNWIIQGAVVTPHLNQFAVESLTKELEKLQPGLGLNFIFTFYQREGDLANWVFDEDYTADRGQYLEKHPEIIERLWQIWQKRVKSFYEFVEKLERRGIKKDTGNFVREYAEFKKRYLAEYSAAFFTEYFTIQSDVIINRIQKKVPREYYQDFEKIVWPDKKSFLNEEELDRLKIDLLLMRVCQKEKPPISQLKFNDLKRKFPTIFNKLKEHQKKFYWIQGNYKYTEPVAIKKFFQDAKKSVKSKTTGKIRKKIKILENYETNFQKIRTKILKKLKLSKKDVESLKLVSRVGWIHDMRKKANLIGNFWINQFLIRASQILKIKRLCLQFTFYEELLAMLEGKGPSKKQISERLKGCATFHNNRGKAFFITGRDFEWLKKEILEKSIQKGIKDFRGTAASYGRARGRVKIITNPLKQKFSQNYILVAPMTRPDYVPLIKRALAVITDEGGVTSHAAVVSREFGIPCIVGTKIATKVLKDNDLVEVSAVHGVIRILK